MGRSSDSKKHSKKSDSNSVSRLSERARKEAKRLKRKEEKLTEKLKKIERKRLKKIKKRAKRELAIIKNETNIQPVTLPPLPPVNIEEKSANVPIGLMDQSRSMAPMTKEEWEKRQSLVRRVLDEESGRYRLIKGDGEVLEEIVSQKRHKEINQHATQADGAFFLSKSGKR